MEHEDKKIVDKYISGNVIIYPDQHYTWYIVQLVQTPLLKVKIF